MSVTLWTSPRGTARVELDDRAQLRFESDEEWCTEVRTLMRVSRRSMGPRRSPLEHDAIVAAPSPSSYPTLVARFAPARSRADRTMSLARACKLVASLADLVRAHHEGGGEALGPFDPALVVETDAGDRMIAPGLVRIAQSHDQGMRGLRGGATIAHYRSTYDQLRGRPAMPHDVTSLAVLAIELVAGREPYPRGSEMDYLDAVVSGRHEDLATLLPRASGALRSTLERALAIEISRRPTLIDLRDALLGELGARDGDAAARPWWKLW